MALEYYKYINRACIITQHTVPQYHEKEVKGLPLLDDAVQITLSQFDPVTKDFITAHKVKDYRRKQFTMTLLPCVNIMFDRLLEGSSFWDEKLLASGTYSRQ